MSSNQAASELGLGVPVLLLKTKSTPGDSYEDLLSTPQEAGLVFEPAFVPVLQHSFDEDGLAFVRDVLQRRTIHSGEGATYGGLVFTSQRAVEAFTKLVHEPQADRDESWPHLQDVPVYSVGPATTRALSAVPQQPPLQIHGSHTGNGAVLSPFILDHYGEIYASRVPKPGLLFPVGEQRRDIIPKTLMDPALPDHTRIQVTEVPIYGTGVMESFPEDFARVLEATASRPVRWVVVFSPTGCDGMLRGLGLLDEATGKAGPKLHDDRRGTFVATIGPTTRDHLIHSFGFEPDVCAEKPSPEGVLEGIVEFMKKLGGGQVD